MTRNYGEPDAEILDLSKEDFIRVRTIITPRNHSGYIFIVLSAFNRKMGVGKTRVEKCFQQSFYVPIEHLDYRAFADEQQQKSYHEQLANHYFEAVWADELKKKREVESVEGVEGGSDKALQGSPQV